MSELKGNRLGYNCVTFSKPLSKQKDNYVDKDQHLQSHAGSSWILRKILHENINHGESWKPIDQRSRVSSL